MADVKLKSHTELRFEVHLTLTESEARALEAICGYGPNAFVQWFYRNLGKHYLKPHEDGMRSLFTTVKRELPTQLSKIDRIAKFIKDSTK